MILNKRPNLTPYISLTLKFIFMLILTCETCVRAPSFTWGELAECASTGEDVKTVLSCCQSRNACVNISVPVKLLAKSSASLWVLFSKPQTNGTRPPRAERALRLVCRREIVRRVTPPGAGIHFWADNNHVGLFVPSSVTTTEPAWGSGTRPAGETHRHNFYWIELTGLALDGWTRRKAQIQNRHKVTEIKIFLYFYHNQGWSMSSSCLQVLSRCLAVTSCPVLFYHQHIVAILSNSVPAVAFFFWKCYLVWMFY